MKKLIFLLLFPLFIAFIFLLGCGVDCETEQAEKETERVLLKSTKNDINKGVFIGQIVPLQTDANERLRYRLIHQEVEGLFIVTSRGQIYMTDTTNREKHIYTVTYEATDGVFTSKARVYVKRN